MEPQQTRQWLDARSARITSSMCHVLVAPKSLGSAELADTAKTYIRRQYAELTTGIIAEVKAWQMEWGKENEPIAREEFEKAIGQDIIVCDFIGHSKKFWWGGSPDGFITRHLLNSNIEIKCPATTQEHYNNIELCGTIEKFKVGYPECYWQKTSNMLLLTDYGHPTYKSIFISFDPRIKIGDNRFFQKEFELVEADAKLLLQQLDKAWAYYKQLGKRDGVDVEFLLNPVNEEQRYLKYIDPKITQAREELAAIDAMIAAKNQTP